MSKRKNHTQNSLLYWWNEFLFARYFEYEIDQTPDELAENLRALAHEPQGPFFWAMFKKAQIELHPNEKGLDFSIQTKRKRRLDLWGITTASASGSAVVDSATGNLIVSGAVKFGRLFHIIMLFYAAYFVVFLPSLISAEMANMGGMGSMIPMFLPLVIMGAMMAFYWRGIYRDRNDLADRIAEAANEGKAKRGLQRLDDAAAELYADDTEYAQQRKRAK